MFILAIIFLLLHLIPLFWDTSFLWGMDSWNYLNSFFPILFSVIVLVSFDKRIRNSLLSFNESILSGSKFKRNLIILIPFFILSILLQQKTFFLGDGYLRIRNLESGVFFSGTEPFVTFLHSILYKFINIFFIVKGETVYAFVSQITGVFTLYFVLDFIDKIVGSKHNKVFILLAFFTMSTIQIFFGYVESYALIILFLALFITSSLISINADKPSVVPAIAFAFALASHTLMILLLPAFIYLLFSYKRHISGKKVIIQSTIIFIFIFVTLIAVVGIYTGENPISKYLYSSDSNIILNLFADNNSYGFFSFGHFIDILNELLLIFPLIVLFPFIYKEIKNLNKNIKNYLLILLVVFLFQMLLINPVLGYSRDWDLFSFISIPLFFLFAFLVKDIKREKLLSSLILIIIGILHTFSFIIINANEDASIQRADELANTSYWSDKSRSLLYDEFAQYYKNNDDLNKAIEMNNKAYSFEKNPRYLYRSATLSMKLNNFSDAEKYLTELNKTDFANAETYNLLADIYFDSKRYEQAIILYKKTISLEPDNFLAYNNIGLIYLNLNRFKDAIDVFMKSIALNPKDSYIYYYLSISYLNIDDLDNAEDFALKAESIGYKKSIIDQLLIEINKKR